MNAFSAHAAFKKVTSVAALLFVSCIMVLCKIRHNSTLRGILEGTGQTLNKQSEINPPTSQPKSVESAINSATGSLFRGEKIVAFEGERLFVDATIVRKIDRQDKFICDKWNVCTTIFPPSEAVIRAANVTGWCTVIIADTKTPHDYMALAGLVGMESMVHYLSVSDQQAWLELESNLAKSSAIGMLLAAIPYAHFARKNVGYLYAIAHGAKLLFDFDDDNLLPVDSATGKVFPPLTNLTHLEGARMVLTGPTAFNHHRLMGATITNSWARGFPLQYIQDTTTQGQIAYEGVELDLMESVGVLQFCANGNPDIDAIHRLVHPLPMNFALPLEGQSSAASTLESSPLVVPSHAFAPYNAQATIHTYKALWALLLPYTVPGRVSDIWRGYFAQALFRDLSLSVVFLPPIIVQNRNDHNILADMDAELDLYSKGGKLIEFLSSWDTHAESIPERMEELWIELYERGYIGIDDVKVVQMWLLALTDAGYEFPQIVRHRLDHTVLLGQFNYGATKETVLFWHQKWRQWFNRIVVAGPFKDTDVLELQMHGIHASTSAADRGYYSPMENLASTLQELKNDDIITGVLYVHDDLIFNTLKNQSIFQDFNFGTNHLLTTYSSCTKPGIGKKNYTDHYEYSIHPNKTYSIQGMPHTREEVLALISNWNWHGTCMDGFERLIADPRSSILQIDDGSIPIPGGCQSDIMYVPTSVADDFFYAARLMVDKQVFLECGMPKIADFLKTSASMSIDSVSLCTNWGGNRGTMNMIAECCLSGPTVIHPFKISMGLSAWNQVFESVTMKHYSETNC